MTKLDRTRVIRTALRLLDDVGLERLTLRRIAAELDVRAPALYWHFRNKRELIDAMATTVLADCIDEQDTAAWPTLDWREFLRRYASGLRGALLRYRDGAKMVPGTYLTDPSLYSAMEKALHALVSHGFPAGTASVALSTTYSYTVGFAIEEQAMFPRPDAPDPRYDTEARRDRIDAAAQPTVAELIDEMPLTDADTNFADGLELIIAGLGTRLDDRG